MRPPTKPEVIAKIKTLLLEGKTQMQTAALAGVARKVVERCYRELKLPPRRDHGKPPAATKNPHLDEWEATVPNDNTIWSYGFYAGLAGISLKDAIARVNAMVGGERVRVAFPGAFQWIPPADRFDATFRPDESWRAAQEKAKKGGLG